MQSVPQAQVSGHAANGLPVGTPGLRQGRSIDHAERD
jgi:hypothetical protein